MAAGHPRHPARSARIAALEHCPAGAAYARCMLVHDRALRPPGLSLAAAMLPGYVGGASHSLLLRARCRRRRPVAGLMTVASAALTSLLVAGAATDAPRTPTRCASDESCNLNGLCTQGACSCFAPWSGATCGVLDELPAPRTAAFGDNCGDVKNCSAPHTASWGANVVQQGSSYHMYVSPLTQDCPLLNWMTNMDVVHAVSTSPLGPFVAHDTAIPPFSTNPHAIVDTHGDWWLFHLGDGDNKTQQAHCQPNGSAITAGAGATRRNSPPPPAPTQPVHRSSGPNGPWTPQPSPACNNPAPALVRIGGSGSKQEARLMCSACDGRSGDFCVQRSTTGFGGPWEKPIPVKIADPRPEARWEDPFIWQERPWRTAVILLHPLPLSSTLPKYFQTLSVGHAWHAAFGRDGRAPASDRPRLHAGKIAAGTGTHLRTPLPA